jgi:hypothetical protein
MNRKILSLLLAGMLTLTSLTAFVACEEEDEQIEDADDKEDDKEGDKDSGDKKEENQKSKLPSELYASILTANSLTIHSLVESGGYTTDYVVKYDGTLLYRKNVTDLFVPGMNENEEYYIEIATGTKYSCDKNGVWTKTEGEAVDVAKLLDEMLGITKTIQHLDLQYADYDSKTGRYHMTEEMASAMLESPDYKETAGLVAYIAETANGFERILQHNQFGETAKTDSKWTVVFECDKMTLPTV